MSDHDTVSRESAELVLDQLGLSAPPAPDLDGLTVVYRAWCRSVPFDNLRKLISLREAKGDALPGLDAEDFLRCWRRHGTGGTCWPSSNALTALLVRCGFDARLVAASMFDTGDPSHGTTIVSIDGAEWLVDTSMLTDEPLPLRDQPTAIADPVHATTAEPVAEGWLFQFGRADEDSTMPCRTLSTDAISHDFCVERYEISRTWSPFNESVYVRHNDDLGVIAYAVEERHRHTADGYERSELAGAALDKGARRRDRVLRRDRRAPQPRRAGPGLTEGPARSAGVSPSR